MEHWNQLTPYASKQLTLCGRLLHLLLKSLHSLFALSLEHKYIYPEGFPTIYALTLKRKRTNFGKYSKTIIRCKVF
jgi:hypothetical protein